MNRHPPVTRLASLALGLLAVAWPLPWSPAWTYPVAALGALAALPLSRAPVPAVAAAILASAFSDAPLGVLAAEGLFILCYLLLADAPPAVSHPGTWLRHQLPVLVAAVAAGAASLSAFAIRPAASPWLTVTGIAAAVAAYLIALPKRAPEPEAPQASQAPQAPQASMSSDASS